MSEAAERLAEVQGHIVDAAERAQREAGEICLIAVSKTYDAPAIRPLIAAGQRHFGENRVQERSEEHTSELQSLMRTSYAVFCLQQKNHIHTHKRHLRQQTTKK